MRRPSRSKMRGVSAPGLVVFMFTATFAFVDWIMSLSPRMVLYHLRGDVHRGASAVGVRVGSSRC